MKSRNTPACIFQTSPAVYNGESLLSRSFECILALTAIGSFIQELYLELCNLTRNRRDHTTKITNVLVERNAIGEDQYGAAGYAELHS
jgi:hypothetical protein